VSPDLVEHWTQEGHACRNRGDPERAIDAYSRAATLDPDDPACWVNLAFAFLECARVEEANAISARLLQMLPEYPEAQMLRGRVCEELGDHAASLSHLNAAIALRPDFASAHCARATQLLRRGSFAEGWADHEWGLAGLRRQGITAPQWRGEPLEGRTILLHAEQGLGDTIQFARYVPLVAERGGTVFLEVPRSLARLMQGTPGIAGTFVRGDPLPDVDLHCPLPSLPVVFRTDSESIPATVPYLAIAGHAPHCERISGSRDRLRVGLAWAGDAANHRDRFRSARLEDLSPLLDRSLGIDWYSLQVDRIPRDMPPELTPLSDLLSDFYETAGAILDLDLVVSVDTAVAHLAGALGHPVWVMLHAIADWRYHLVPGSTPWYPTMKLFRQIKPGDWSGPVAQIAEELARLRSSR
jgi:hypothetical protein